MITFVDVHTVNHVNVKTENVNVKYSNPEALGGGEDV